MALDIKTRYGSRANDPSIDYPTGSIKNKTAPASTDGTPLEQDWANDWLGARDAILQAALIVANGAVEKAGASQVLEAIQKIATDAAEAIEQPQASIQGSFKNLKGSATGLSAFAPYTTDQIIVEDGSGNSIKLNAVSINPSLSASGVNGLDTGVSAASTWYSEWVIYNTTTLTTAGLFSLSATAPTMPSGYTHKARVGWVRSDGTANKYPIKFAQNGRGVQYVVASGTNLVSLPLAASGAIGTYSTTLPTWAAISLTNFVPTTAGRVKLVIHNAYNSATSSTIVAAPSNSYAGQQSTNPPPCVAGSADGKSGVYDWLIESNNVYAAGGAAFAMQVMGWEDNL